MTVRDVSYIEIYTRDKIPVVRFLVAALGFVRVADSVEVDRSSVLLRHGDVRMVVTSGWATCRSRPGRENRIADIAVTCDDVNAVCDTALAAGGTVTRSAHGNAVVSGIGDVTYTLLPEGARTGFLGDGRNWVASTPQAPPPGRDGPDRMTLRLDLKFPDKHAAFYRDVLNVASPSPVPAPTSFGTDVFALRSASGRMSVILVAGDRTGNPAAGRRPRPDHEPPLRPHR